MKKILSYLAFALYLVAFTGCADNGKKYTLDKDHEVYYKGEGLDEGDAKKLAAYLKEQQYFQEGKKATVQIYKSKKSKDTINLNFIVDETKINSDMESEFILFGGKISKNVFASSPLTVHLSDKNVSEIKNLGFAGVVAAEPLPEPVHQDAPPQEQQ